MFELENVSYKKCYIVEWSFKWIDEFCVKLVLSWLIEIEDEMYVLVDKINDVN